jgi:hypothetical protein
MKLPVEAINNSLVGCKVFVGFVAYSMSRLPVRLSTEFSLSLRKLQSTISPRFDDMYPSIMMVDSYLPKQNEDGWLIVDLLLMLQ